MRLVFHASGYTVMSLTTGEFYVFS